MKKLLVLFVFGAVFLNAAVIQCAVQINLRQEGVDSVPFIASCPGAVPVNGPNWYITGAQLALLGSFNDTTLGDLHQVNFTADGISPDIAGDLQAGGPPAIVIATTSAGELSGDTGTYVTGAIGAVSPTLSLAGFDVVLNYTVIPGTTAPLNVSVALAYITEETFIPPNGEVPEPGTFAMLGGALLGVAGLARRKK
jgi:hypothetical protein